MTIISRYVFRQAAGSLLLILSSLTGIVWIALALRQLNVVTSEGQDAWMLIKMTTLALPNLMAVVAPFALLIAAIQVLSRLNGDSELIVMTAAGATIATVARPLIVLALLVMGGVAFVNHLGMPWSLRLLREYTLQMRADLLTQVIQPGRFSSPEENLTFHIRERALSGELLGLMVHDTRDKKQAQSYLAEHGVIVKQPPSIFLVMSEGHIVRRSSGTEPAQIIAFDRYIVDLNRFEAKETKADDLKPRERYYDELLHPDPNGAYFRAQPGQFRSELHERISSPLYPLVFVLIALASVGQAQSTRQNRSQRMVAGFVLATTARVAGLAIINLVSVDARWVPVLYALPAFAMLACVVAMIRAARPRGRWRFAELVEDGLTRLWGRLLAPLRRAAASQPTGRV